MSRDNKLEQHILALEMELNIIQQDIEALEKEIVLVGNLCHDLQENLSILKKANVVATIKSYQESKNYLGIQSKILNTKQITLDKLNKEIENKSELLEKLYSQHIKNHEEKENGKNVLILPTKK